MGATLRIEIFPADVDASVGFYERVGFELVGLKEGPPRYASMRWDDVRIGMAESPRHPRQYRAVPVGTEIVIPSTTSGQRVTTRSAVRSTSART